MKPAVIRSGGSARSAAGVPGLSAGLRKQLQCVLIPPAAIQGQIRKLARAIVRDHGRRKEPLQMVVVLKGGAFFGVHLAQEIFRQNGPAVRLNFIHASSYGGATASSGSVHIEGRLPAVKGRRLLIVEDIVDTGLTLWRLKQHLLKKRNAASVSICALLSKPDRRLPWLARKLEIDYTGFVIPDLFVVGFGLDCAESFRELPFIAAVKAGAPPA